MNDEPFDPVEHVRGRVAGHAGDPSLNGVDLTIEQHITGAADEIVYHLTVRDGSIEVIDGPAPAPDIVISQDADTAESLRGGQIHAQTAFLTGALTIDGDVHKVLAHKDLLVRLSGTAGRA